MSPAAPSGGMRIRGVLAIGFAIVLASLAGVPAAASPVGGNRVWLQRVANAGYAYGEAVSADGATVVVTGDSGTTAAYDANSGVKRWIAVADEGTVNAFFDIAISPDSTRAYVVGYSYTNPKDTLLVASYDVATGAQLWLVKYDGPTSGGAIGRSVAVSPDGSTVYVIGTSTGLDTLAYAADTGAQLWEALYPGGDAIDLSLSGDGSTVFVEGSIAHVYNDFVTVAYGAGTGTQLWATQYNSGGTRGDTPVAIAVSPDGGRVFVTGCTGDFDYCVNGYMVTLAYDATTGTELWTALHQGAGQGDDSATDLTVSPDGSFVYVVGSSESKLSYDYAVVAYAASTGAAVWTSAYRGPGNENDYPCCVELSPDGTRLYVTGDTGVNWATVSYDALTGKQQWAATYDGPGHGTDLAFALGLSPDGAQVYVTGTSARHGYDFTTIDYGA